MAYIGNSPGVASQRVETAFTATSNQTAFTPSSGYTLGYCDVYQNGVKLVNGDDYTASDGVTVTLATGAASGDSIVIVASFPRGLSDGYLKSEADARYPLVTDSSATANGVLYRNGSKVLTAGSALVFDGTSLGIGTPSPTKPLDVVISATGDQSMISLRTTGASGQGLLLGVNTTNSVTTIKNNASSTYGMAFFAGSGSAEQMRLNSDGNLLLGGTSTSTSTGGISRFASVISTGSGNSVLTVESTGTTANANYAIIDFVSRSQVSGETRYAEIFSSRSSTSTSALDGFIGFATATAGSATEKARIDSNGVLLLNATSRSGAPDHTSVKLAVNGEVHLQSQGSHIWFGDSTNSAPIGIGEGLVNTVGTDQDFLSVYYRSSCRFFTSTTEVARFDNSGNFLFSATGVGNANPGIHLRPNGTETANTPRFDIVGSASTVNNTIMQVYSSGAGAYRFYVQWNGQIYASQTTISGISDVRFKENIVDLDVGLAAIMALKPRKFDWKEGKGKDIKGDRGFIAQEFEEVFPDLIDQWKDPAPEGEEPYKSVKQELIPVLVKAIQEQQAIIEQLQADVATLKGTP